MKYLKHKKDNLHGFAEEVCALMSSLVRKAIKWDNNHLSRGLITIPQLHILFFLETRDFCQMRDIAEEMGLKGSTLTAMIDKLVELGFVRRFSGEEDRRAVIVSITQKGKKMLNELKEDRKKMIIRMFANLNAGERRNYISILKKILQYAADDFNAKGTKNAKG